MTVKYLKLLCKDFAHKNLKFLDFLLDFILICLMCRCFLLTDSLFANGDELAELKCCPASYQYFALVSVFLIFVTLFNRHF